MTTTVSPNLDDSPVTPWVAYVPALGGVGTPSSVNFWYRRIGDTLHIKGSWVNGTITAVAGSVSLPAGLTTATSKGNTAAGGQWEPCGTLTRSVNSGTLCSVLTRPGEVGLPFSAYGIAGVSPAPANGAIPTANQYMATGEYMHLNCSVPIQGW